MGGSSSGAGRKRRRKSPSAVAVDPAPVQDELQPALSPETTVALESTPGPLRLEYRTASELKQNPRNWREHPAEQREALQELIDEVGWAGAVLFNERTGRLIDGHLRQSLDPNARIPVLIGDWSEEHEAKILATFDPIGAMAKTNDVKLRELLDQVEAETPAVQALLDELTPETPAEDDDADDVDGEKKPEEFSVLVKCANEQDQKAILGELARHNLDCRALCVGFPPVREPDAAAMPELQAGEIRITRESKVDRTPRVVQMEGMFDVPPAKKHAQAWTVNLTLDKPWNVGLIVGPSGCGKSTVAREVFGDRLVNGWDWPKSKSILDGFPAALSIQEITGLLSSVGFSSPPSWVKPFHVLSNGEQFRVNLARTLAELPDLAVVDEFTSVVDRQVAQIGSAAVAKTVRASGRRFVAVACHYDIEEWLQPDWKFEPATGELTWRCLRRRPPVQLSIRRTDTSAWALFRGHHYLSGELNRSAHCFIAEVAGRPAAFAAAMYFPHFNGGWWREHRTVCLPDFQGVGIGNALSEFVASLFTGTGAEYRSTTSHPSMIRHRVRSPKWLMIRAPSMQRGNSGDESWQKSSRGNGTGLRMTAGFSYIGEARPTEAREFGLG